MSAVIGERAALARASFSPQVSLLMTAIFISQPSSDDAEAEALKNRFGEQGPEQLFLDFDPADGIPASVDRGQRHRDLRRCQAPLMVLQRRN